MSKLDELMAEWEKDSQIDRTEPGKALIDIPKLHSKYLRILSNHKLLIKDAEFKYARMKKIKWEYYTGKTDAETLKQKGLEPFNLKVLKQDLDLYIDSDQDILQLDSKLITQQEKVDYLQDAIKAINNMQWHIRDAIAWRKFINGVN